MPQSGMYCPMCDREQVSTELIAYQQKMVCPASLDHSWNDLSELILLRPRLVPQAKKADTVQDAYTPITLKVPVSVKESLDKKYGEKLSTSLTSVLQACAEEKMMILAEVDLDRIAKRLSTKAPTSSSELFGLIFAVGEEKTEMRNEVERLKRRLSLAGGKSGDAIVVDLGDWQEKAVGKAAEAGLDLETYLSKYLQDSVENDWLT